MINNNTPVETYSVQDIGVWVKREDMAAKPPAPPFSKVRGLYAHMTKLKAKGVGVVGYVETSISMAGWGVAWAAQSLGMKAVIYDPQYKETPSLLRSHRRQWKQFHPDLVSVPAGRARVNYYRGVKHLHATYGAEAVMLDLGLPLEETIQETAAEWDRTMDGLSSPPGTTVINIGSGTICAGVLRGWRPGEGVVIGVLGRSSNLNRKTNTISSKAQRSVNGLIGVPLRLEDPGWEYTDKSTFKSPFPCHPYYDMKAWEWLCEHIEKLTPPILFWNIGRMRS